MGSINVGLQEFAVTHISKLKENFEVVGKREAGIQKESRVKLTKTLNSKGPKIEP
jgi:hypothetical protein